MSAFDLKDVLIDTYVVKSPGFGVPKVGVRATHMPSWTVTLSADKRSEHANKAEALRLLELAVAQLELDLAQPVPEAMTRRDHEIAKLVNDLRDVAIKFHNHQSLRDRISRLVVPFVKGQS